MTTRQSIPLSQLTGALSVVIHDWSRTQGCVWLLAEVVKCKRHHNGNCYLTLVEKVGQSIVARADATLWATEAYLLRRFEVEAGEPLAVGVAVKLQVQVRFHVVYGLELTVYALEPLHKLGEIERSRREALARLECEGLLAANKALLLPLAPQRIAIVSSPTSAGYEDFLRHLHHNTYGYAFSTVLFPVTLQGREAVASIIRAIQNIMVNAVNFDVLVVLRGGGSADDLHVFDDYRVASVMARCPLPVLTGIGHERDETVADAVAHTALSTPTATADFLIERLHGFENRLNGFSQQIESAARRSLALQRAMLAQKQFAMTTLTNRRMTRCREQLEAALHKASRCLPSCLHQQEKRLNSQSVRVLRLSHDALRSQESRLTHLAENVCQQSRQQIQSLNASLEAQRVAIGLASPQHLLKRGYCLVRQEGKVLRDAAVQVQRGEPIEIQTQTGMLLARIENVIRKESVHGAISEIMPAGNAGIRASGGTPQQRGDRH